MNRTHTNFDWQALAQALREEIQEYAWMLQLTCDLQKGILQRNSQAILELNESLADQLQITVDKRNTRQSLQQTLADYCGLALEHRLIELIPHIPETIQSMFYALVDEANRLIERLSRKTKQNEAILKRAGELSGDLLQALRPGAVKVKTYNRLGVYGQALALPGSVIQTAV
ncbi:MAG: hypothetical protein JW739_03260 [Opitutales bacterium]|nr:hypothetical protein [Opitutales bacterium]